MNYFLLTLLVLVTFPSPSRSDAWNNYIDNLIGHSQDAQGKKHVTKACIIGLDGGAEWTTSAHADNLNLSEDERTAIADAFKKGDTTTFQKNGIYANGVKYQFLRYDDDDDVLLGQKKDVGAFTAQRSKTAVVIAITDDTMQQGNANKAVAVIAEYLESLGL